MFAEDVAVQLESPRPIAARIRALFDKRRDDKVRAIKATFQHALRRAAFWQSKARFRRFVADDMDIMRHRLHTLAVIEQERYVKGIFADSLYNDKRRLPPFGFKVYSQNDEDGIIQEIFARIGQRSRTFVEFGVGDGLENNTLKLLLEGWSGLWVEGSEDSAAGINKKFYDVIQQGRLQVRHAFIDRDNINRLVGQSYTGEIDLISIDVDGNDIHLLEALDVVSARALVIEYNAKFAPPLSIAQAYNAAHRWRGTDYMGSSLAAITKIAERKGYALVGCNVVGINAFFVRHDLLEDKFCPPYTAENHYQPARYFLWQTFAAGHEPDWGPYVAI
jgi:hypothetical protein